MLLLVAREGDRGRLASASLRRSHMSHIISHVIPHIISYIICAVGWLVDWLVVCLYWVFARVEPLALVEIGGRGRRPRATVVGVVCGRGRCEALVVDLVCPL